MAIVAGVRSFGVRRTAVFTLLTALVLAGLAGVLSTPTAVAVDYTLYGDGGRGWGFAPGSISSPGPTLFVTRGEMVHLSLFSADGFAHTWCIDYDGSNSCGVPENESMPFSSMTTPEIHMFSPTGAPGTYTYICGIHTGLVMNGLIRILAAVKPIVSISSPTGTQRWTGGTPHDIVWTMTDPQDPVPSLNATLAYSTSSPNGPWTLIAGPIPGTTNPHSFPWAVPVVNSTTVYVNVSAMDPLGNQGSAVAPVPVIDSTAPSLVGRSPPNGSSGIALSTNIVAQFDEAMNRAATATPGTAALQDTSTLAWIPVTYSWSGLDTVLTMDPVPTLAPTTMYRASVNVSAMDASDPGNALSAASAWVFTTATGPDLVPPRISNVVPSPTVAEYPAPIGVTATITDNDAVAAAYVNVIRPDTSPLNLSMALISGSTWGISQAYTTTPPNFASMIGNYLFRVDAVDASGNWNRSSQGTFAVQDTTRPSLSNLAATPSPADAYGAVNVTVTVSDPFLVSVDVVVNGTNASMSPGAPAGTWYRVFTPTNVGAYPFVVWAVDAAGNHNSASGTVAARDTTPPPIPMGLIATATGGAIQLGWTGGTAPDLDGYKVYRSTSPSPPFTTQVGPAVVRGTAFTDQTVQPGVTYYYVVTAVDVRGHESGASNVASATVPSTTGTDFTPVIIAAVVIAIIVAALVAVLLLRRRRETPPKT